MYIDENGYDWLKGDAAYGYFCKTREDETIKMKFAGNYNVIIVSLINLVKYVAKIFNKNEGELFAEIGLRGGFIKEE